MSEYVLSLSYGKDSLACLGAIEKLGWPLTRIVHAEIWATDTIPADLPPMVEFKAKADEIIKQRWGIEVEHVCATDKDGTKLTYEKIFYRVPKRRAGGSFDNQSFAGFPYTTGAWCNDRLKTRALDNIATTFAPPPPIRSTGSPCGKGIGVPLISSGKQSNILFPTAPRHQGAIKVRWCSTLVLQRTSRRDWPDWTERQKFLRLQQ